MRWELTRSHVDGGDEAARVGGLGVLCAAFAAPGVHVFENDVCPDAPASDVATTRPRNCGSALTSETKPGGRCILCSWKSATLDVRTRVAERRRARIVFEQEIHCKNRLLIKALFTVACVRIRDFRPCALPEFSQKEME